MEEACEIEKKSLLKSFAVFIEMRDSLAADILTRLRGIGNLFRVLLNGLGHKELYDQKFSLTNRLFADKISLNYFS